MTQRTCTLLSSLALAVVGLAAAPPTTEAQARPPEACGMTDANADYGGVSAGSVVTLQRHRLVDGEDNWDPAMSRWLGRAARVIQLAGVDAQGCAGVRVDLDGQHFFWRLRDLGVGTGPQPRPATARGSAAPLSGAFEQSCGQDAGYGALAVGAEVVLGRHRAIEGDANWTPEMQPFVGRRARVTELVGPDAQGCPGVRVDADSGEWFWRVRDLQAPAGQASLASAASPHGRPVAVYGRAPQAWGGGGGGEGGGGTGGGLFGSGGGLGPQACGMSDATVDWGSIAVGTAVTLGRHRAVGGEENWADAMAEFVGRSARVEALIGVDDQGCPVVRVDADAGQHFWRVRDMMLLPPAP